MDFNSIFNEYDYIQDNDLYRLNSYDFNNNLNNSNYYIAYGTENSCFLNFINPFEIKEGNSLNSENFSIKSSKTKNTSEEKGKDNSSNIKPSSIISSKTKNISEEKGKDNISNIKPSSIVSSKTINKSKKLNKKFFNISEGPIFEIIKINQKKLGRKRKGNNQNSKHNKYDGDNIIRKLKCFLVNALLEIINSSIEEREEEEPNKILKTKKIKNWSVNKKPFLLKIDQEIIHNINIDYNLNLLKLTLRELFSNDISKKYLKKFKKSYNREIIQSLYKDNNNTKTIGILNMTFKECLDYLSGSNFNNELQGLEIEYKKIIDSFKKDGESEEYINLFKYYIKNFENYYNNKRKTKKNNNN